MLLSELMAHFFGLVLFSGMVRFIELVLSPSTARSG